MSDTEPAPTVLLVGDQELVRAGFRLILTTRGIEVAGEANDGAEAVTQARRLQPDVVLMDIRMPNMDGLEATRRVLREAPDCRVIILTTFDLDRYVYDALASGASGFLLKDVTPEHLAAAVRLVTTGDALLAPSITRRLVARYAGAHPNRPSAGGRDLTQLTPRELEVLTHLGRGLSNAELADTLTLSEATVKTHVARIFTKLDLRDRAQAVIVAYEAGLIEPERGQGDGHRHRRRARLWSSDSAFALDHQDSRCSCFALALRSRSAPLGAEPRRNPIAEGSQYLAISLKSPLSQQRCFVEDVLINAFQLRLLNDCVESLERVLTRQRRACILELGCRDVEFNDGDDLAVVSHVASHSGLRWIVALETFGYPSFLELLVGHSRLQRTREHGS